MRERGGLSVTGMHEWDAVISPHYSGRAAMARGRKCARLEICGACRYMGVATSLIGEIICGFGRELGSSYSFLAFISRCAWRMSGPSNAYSGKSDVAKEELLTMEGFVEEVLPDGRFAVMLDNEHRIIAYTAGKMRKFRIRTVAGDRVHVEMTPYDLTKGRIVFRERSPGQAAPGKRGNFRR